MTKRLRRWIAPSDDEDSLPYHLDEQGALTQLVYLTYSRTGTSDYLSQVTKCTI
jgi:hypothetical protein